MWIPKPLAWAMIIFYTIVMYSEIKAGFKQILIDTNLVENENVFGK